MSLTLADRQQIFAAALLDPDAAVPAGVVGPGGAPDVRRFAVYRNNVMVSLTEALAARFPVCERLVGGEFFRAMAHVFVASSKPRSPLLMVYGDDFPDFIGGFAPAEAVPYLADVARLEAAWTEAYHAADATALDAGTLGSLSADRIAGARLKLHPSTRLVRSPFPVASIWQANQTDDPAIAADDWGPEDVLVVRPDGDVLMHRLPTGGFAFINALLECRTLTEAAEAGCDADAGFDPGAALAGLLTLGVIVAFAGALSVEMK